MQTHLSRVAILIPILNEEANLKKLLSSISSQSHTNFDVYIQDNASDDNSLWIVKDYVNQDPRFQVFSNSDRLEAHENWWTLASKVGSFETYDFVTWLAGDDVWSDQYYLEKLVLELISNPNYGAVCPTFNVTLPTGELHKSISIGLNSKSAMSRILSLCKNWDAVHHIYALYRSNIFTSLLASNTSKFNSYLGSDWWWTYTFLSRYRSGLSSSTIYIKTLEETYSSAPTAAPSRRIRIYVEGLESCWRPEITHLQKLRFVEDNYRLAIITGLYFSGKALKKIVHMHKKILVRNLSKIRRVTR
jgi:glycosyltransferase involved in cell wall biosynthesis